MEQVNPKLKTCFETFYKRSLTEAEVKEYKERLVGFFSLLIDIDQRNKRKGVEKND